MIKKDNLPPHWLTRVSAGIVSAWHKPTSCPWGQPCPCSLAGLQLGLRPGRPEEVLPPDNGLQRHHGDKVCVVSAPPHTESCMVAAVGKDGHSL